jgi:hypothetical protein
MTEQEWLGGEDPWKLLAGLPAEPSERKWRLFMCALLRRFWCHLENDHFRKGIEVVERFVDGLADITDLDEGRRAISKIQRSRSSGGFDLVVSRLLLSVMDAPRAVSAYSYPLDIAFPERVRAQFAPGASGKTEAAAQVTVLRDIIGNPFHPVTLDPAWLTSAVLSLAQAAYTERLIPNGSLDPTRLAILADALEEAGCTELAVIGHLRGPAPHVRGCWSVDLALAKE